MGGRTLTYGDVQELSWKVAGALARSGVRPGDKVRKYKKKVGEKKEKRTKN
jgi:acyl-coenzyme A synthetase/AMP-(fatty) acid ligase